VIEAQCASILVPHDHLHINQMRAFAQGAALPKYTAWPHACAAVAAIAEVRKPIDNRAPTRRSVSAAITID
jgi:hypothetical protein